MFKNNIIPANLKLVQNVNFRNNQNYVISENKKKDIMLWYYMDSAYDFLYVSGLLVIIWIFFSLL